ncbi:hypothetical protein SO574_18665 [Vibrio alfacsensis]|uniref:DUF4405 domain-containing protein n=1 Tax=Vibrio alfacsensis TaxID=1074311 RepID=UPI002ADE92ED|nr:hypothetical protein [Vibrio alfacsensis]WQE77798.1 hypothetical protein SO574_18665 [Vibrio alfacsensis]
MNKQKLATASTIGLSLVVSLTGLLLFFEISSGAIRATHEWISMVFIVAAGVHAYTHKKALVRYFDKKNRLPITLGLCASVALFTVSYGDVYAASAIFDRVIDTPFQTSVGVFGLTSEQAIVSLNSAGITHISMTDTIAEIAHINNTDIYDVIDILLASKQ